MGQYYTIANLDKKLRIDNWKYGCGVKLLEFAYTECDIVTILAKLMAKEWKGDRIVVCGDYINSCDNYVSNSKKFMPKVEEWARELETDVDNFYDKIRGFKTIKKMKPPKTRFRYVVNDVTKEYVDINNCPIEYYFFRDAEHYIEENKISPLIMLLAMGNGLGGGDLNVNNDKVGMWACDTGSVYPAKKKPEGYTELKVCFTQRKEQMTTEDLKDEFIRDLVRYCINLRGRVK